VCGGFLSVFFLFPDFAVHSALNARIVLYILKLSAPINTSFIIHHLDFEGWRWALCFYVSSVPGARSHTERDLTGWGNSESGLTHHTSQNTGTKYGTFGWCTTVAPFFSSYL
jgi:hypothetical protein